jgi:hypothetical protein
MSRVFAPTLFLFVLGLFKRLKKNDEKEESLLHFQKHILHHVSVRATLTSPPPPKNAAMGSNERWLCMRYASISSSAQRVTAFISHATPARASSTCHFFGAALHAVEFPLPVVVDLLCPSFGFCFHRVLQPVSLAALRVTCSGHHGLLGRRRRSHVTIFQREFDLGLHDFSHGCSCRRWSALLLLLLRRATHNRTCIKRFLADAISAARVSTNTTPQAAALKQSTHVFLLVLMQQA